jgi:hypothetical protein
MKLINFVITNIDFFSKVFSIIFTTIASIIAILTYSKAKYTLLQPLRTEVVKKQTDLLLEMFKFLENRVMPSKSLYHDLIMLNIPILLTEYGFIFSKETTPMKNTVNNMIICAREKKLESFSVISTFSENQTQEDIVDTKEIISSSKTKYERLKKNEVDIETLALTDEYSQISSKLDEYIGNIFLPKTIKAELLVLQSEMIENISLAKLVLEKFLLEFYNRYKSDQSHHVRFNPIGVCNEFNRVCISHRNSIITLQEETRKYLRIDNKW